MLSRRTFWSAKLGIAARALEADGLDEATRGHRLRSWRRSTRTVNASRSRRLCLRTSRANRRCRLKLTTRRANATATATRRGVTTCPRRLCCCSEEGRFAGSASMQPILPESWRHDRTSVRDRPASRAGALFPRAVEVRALWIAEDAAHDGIVWIHEAQQLVCRLGKGKSQVRARASAMARALPDRGNPELEGRREGERVRGQAEHVEDHMAMRHLLREQAAIFCETRGAHGEAADRGARA